MMKYLRIFVVIATGLGLALSLSACGKKGALEPPAKSDDEKKNETEG